MVFLPAQLAKEEEIKRSPILNGDRARVSISDITFGHVIYFLALTIQSNSFPTHPALSPVGMFFLSHTKIPYDVLLSEGISVFRTLESVINARVYWTEKLFNSLKRYSELERRLHVAARS